tara:strand:- start:1138 stop:1599 length:462 start_codon:yes stop_codon:yes gene_type:complete
MNHLYPLPITKIRIPIDKWLNTKVKYEENLTIKDILEDMNDKTYQWINDKDDLTLVTDYDSFKNEFIHLIYDYENKCDYDNYHMNHSEEDLYDLKYLEEINSLFLSLKELDDYYNTNIIRGDFNKLFEYIKTHTTIQEFSDDENSDEDDLLEL